MTRTKINRYIAYVSLPFIWTILLVFTPQIQEIPNALDAGTYKVTRVVDGDTVKIDMNGTEETLRLIWIDTPETVHPKKEVECYGPQASAYTKETLADQYIKLEYDETQTQRDRYDRLLVYVIHQGQNFNQNLIEQGYAKEYTYGKAYKYQWLFKTAEKIAQEDNLGLWGECANEKTE